MLCYSNGTDNYKLGTSLSDLRRPLIETWSGIQQSVTDQAFDQWWVCLNVCQSQRKAFWTHAI